MALITDIINSIIGKVNTHTTKLAGIEEGAQVNTVTSVNGKTGAVVVDEYTLPTDQGSDKFLSGTGTYKRISTEDVQLEVLIENASEITGASFLDDNSATGWTLVNAIKGSYYVELQGTTSYIEKCITNLVPGSSYNTYLSLSGSTVNFKVGTEQGLGNLINYNTAITEYRGFIAPANGTVWIKVSSVYAGVTSRLFDVHFVGDKYDYDSFLITSNDGTKYLSDDGTYKEIIEYTPPADQGVDKFLAGDGTYKTPNLLSSLSTKTFVNQSVGTNKGDVVLALPGLTADTDNIYSNFAGNGSVGNKIVKFSTGLKWVYLFSNSYMGIADVVVGSGQITLGDIPGNLVYSVTSTSDLYTLTDAELEAKWNNKGASTVIGSTLTADLEITYGVNKLIEDIISISGDGTKYLSDDGTYKELYSKTEIDNENKRYDALATAYAIALG